MMGSKEELSEDPNFFHYGIIFQILAKLEAVLTLGHIIQVVDKG